MIRRPPRSTRTDTLFPYTTLFRSSQLDHSPISKGGKIHGREPVVIHKADAQRLNLLDGDIVRVFNQRGACLATVVLTENLRQGVVKISTGAWFDPHQMADGQWLDVHGNPNRSEERRVGKGCGSTCRSWWAA